jgi:transposase
LAIDLGKYKSVVCLFRSPDDVRFTSVPTTRNELHRLIEKHRPEVVLIEACLLCGWVRDLCVELGVPCRVANTSSEAWKFKHLKRKTDRDDALRLGEVYRLGKFPCVAIPEKEVREKRGLIEHRQKLVGRRVALQNRLRSILVGQGLPAPRGARAWTVLGLAGIAAYARPLHECGPTALWRGRLHLTLAELDGVKERLDQAEAKLDSLAKTDDHVRILPTIPGVGPRTAEAVAAFLPEPRRFKTTQQVSAYGGFVPRQYQSAETDHRSRITKRGPRTLRKLLVACAWVMLRYNAWARVIYKRLTHGGKTRKKQAIVALARKLLVRCWAMLRDGTVWRADLQPAAETATGRTQRELHERTDPRAERIDSGSRNHAEVRKPKGPVASARSLVDPGDRGLSLQDGLNEWAARRIRMTGTAGGTKAATRIVECIPKASTRRNGPGLRARISQHPCRD